MQIDEIDAIILRELLNNGRKSFSQIAKETKVSHDIIWQHYKQMKKKGIIVGSTILLDYSCLGYFTLATIIVTTEIDQQDKIIKSIKKIDNIYGIIKSNSGPELDVIATLKNMNELDKLKQIIKKLPSVLEMKTEILIGVKQIINNLSIFSFLQKKDFSNTKNQDKNKPIKRRKKIDKIDVQIIDKLSKNSRCSFRQIAKELEISPDTANRRYKKLLKLGVIKPLIQINPKKLGYVGILNIEISFISSDSFSEVIEKIAKIPDVIVIAKNSGTYDLSIAALVMDMKQLFLIKDQILTVSGITKFKTSINKLPKMIPYSKEPISTF